MNSVTQPVKKTFREENRHDWICDAVTDPIIALAKALKCMENQCQVSLLARGFCEIVVSMTCGREASGMVPELWDTFCGKRFGTIWTRGIVCVCAQLPRPGMSQGSMGRTASSFFFLLKKEQVVASNEVLPNPYVSVETDRFVPAGGRLRSGIKR